MNGPCEHREDAKLLAMTAHLWGQVKGWKCGAIEFNADKGTTKIGLTRPDERRALRVVITEMVNRDHAPGPSRKAGTPRPGGGNGGTGTFRPGLTCPQCCGAFQDETHYPFCCPTCRAKWIEAERGCPSCGLTGPVHVEEKGARRYSVHSTTCPLAHSKEARDDD